jgi:hypothetical protein
LTSSLALGAARRREKCRQRHRRARNRASKNEFRAPTECMQREGHADGNDIASFGQARCSPRAIRTSRNCTRENRETSSASGGLPGRRTGLGSQKRNAGAVHRFAPSCDTGTTAGQLLRLKTEGCAWGGRSNLARVCHRAGGRRRAGAGGAAGDRSRLGNPLHPRPQRRTNPRADTRFLVLLLVCLVEADGTQARMPVLHRQECLCYW